MRAEEVRALWRNRNGHTQTRRVDECRGVSEFMDAGATLGDLWMENQFGAGDPLTNQDAPGAPFAGDDE